MGFAVLHVARGDNACRIEDAGIVLCEAIEEAGLSAAGDDDGGEAVGDNLFEQVEGAGHSGCFGIAVEEFALAGVEALDFFGVGVAIPGATGEEAEGAEGRASFVEVDFFGADVESGFVADLRPGFGMAGHGVEEHAVHVEEGGLYGKGVERVAGCGGFVTPFGVRVPIVGEGGGIVWVIHRWEL